MIITSSIRSSEGKEALQRALVELTARDLLSGLSLQGRAISIVERPGVGTMCTDGTSVYYDPAWLIGRKPEDNAFDLLHEWLHIFGNHCRRRDERDPRLWNIAADMVVVHQASEIFSTPPYPYPSDGIIPQPWSIGMSVEQIYDKLKQQAQEQERTQEQEGSPPPELEGVPSDFSPDLLEPARDSEEQQQQFLTTFVGELIQAKTVLENLNRPITKEVRSRILELQQDNTPWGRLLVGDIISDFGFDSPTYSPPNRRYLPVTILPAYRSMRVKLLVIAVDVSGSVSMKLLNRFGSALHGAVARADEVILLSFDSCVRTEQKIRSASQISGIRLDSGAHSHTSTVDVFNRIQQLDPSAYTILTDLFVEFPDQPFHKTIWVTPEQAPQAPWGRQHRMRNAW